MTDEKPVFAEKRFIKSFCKKISGTSKATWNPYNFINVEISKEDFNKLPVNDAGYVKMTLSKKQRWPWPYWDTHYLVLNDYVPEEKKNPLYTNDTDSDLPF